MQVLSPSGKQLRKRLVKVYFMFLQQLQHLEFMVVLLRMRKVNFTVFLE